jgi:hypothetical protein
MERLAKVLSYAKDKDRLFAKANDFRERADAMDGAGARPPPRLSKALF